VKHPITVAVMVDAKPAQGYAPSTVTSSETAQEKRVALQSVPLSETAEEVWICSLVIFPS
jgi:hypothetical protein